jgi:hypothetical protein
MPLIVGGRGGRPGLLGAAARTAVVAGTAQAVGGRVAHRQQQRYAQEAAQQAPPVAAPAPAAAPSAGAVDPLVAQLQQLATLRDQGILTEEEFAAKKAQVLGI